MYLYLVANPVVRLDDMLEHRDVVSLDDREFLERSCDEKLGLKGGLDILVTNANLLGGLGQILGNLDDLLDSLEITIEQMKVGAANLGRTLGDGCHRGLQEVPDDAVANIQPAGKLNKTAAFLVVIGDIGELDRIYHDVGKGRRLGHHRGGTLGRKKERHLILLLFK